MQRYQDIIYKVIGSAMDVYNELNYGLLESIYQEALCLELEKLGLEYEREKELLVYYKGQPLDKKFRLDIIVGDIVCELKSINEINSAHRSQLCNYLRLTKKPVGLLINFGGPHLYAERWLFDQATNRCFIVDKNLNPIK